MPSREPGAVHRAIVGTPGLVLAVLMTGVLVAIVLWQVHENNRASWILDRFPRGIQRLIVARSWWWVFNALSIVSLLGWATAIAELGWSSWRAQHVWAAVAVLGLVGQVIATLSLTL